MIDFHSFETFDPNGPGLGNLFGQVSPFEALGIWPSGDFRLAPGDGAVPALGYYLGAAFALVCSSTASSRCWRRREIAVLAGLAAVALAYAAARARRHPLHRRQGDRDRRPARRPDDPPAAAQRCELALCGLWRAQRLTGIGECPAAAASSSPPPASARCSRSPTRRSGRPPTRRRSPGCARWSPTTRPSSSPPDELLADEHGDPLPRLGAARRPGLHRGRERSGRGAAAGRPLRRHRRRRRASRPSPGLRVRRVAAPYVLWESTRPGRRPTAPAR